MSRVMLSYFVLIKYPNLPDAVKLFLCFETFCVLYHTCMAAFAESRPQDMMRRSRNPR